MEIGRWCCPRAGYWTACISSGPRTSHPSCLDAYNTAIAISVDGAWSSHSLLYPTQVLNSKPLPFYENYINHFLRGEEKKSLKKQKLYYVQKRSLQSGTKGKNSSANLYLLNCKRDFIYWCGRDTKGGMQGILWQCATLLLVGSRKMMKMRNPVFLEGDGIECRARIRERWLGTWV